MTQRDRIVLNLSFVAAGAVAVLLGSLLPHMMARLGMTDAEAGRLFLAQFLASTAGAMILGILGRRWRMELCLAIAYLLMGGAVIGLANAGRSSTPLWVAGYGLALGLCIPAANMIVGRGAGESSASALNLLNMSWSFGATLSPPVSGYLLWRYGSAAVIPGIGALALLAGAACSGLRGITAGRTEFAARFPLAPEERSTAFWTGAFLFLYVGTESILSGWLPAHSFRSAGIAGQQTGLPQGVFWGAILAGRLFVGMRSRQADPERWIPRGLAVAFTGIAILIVATRAEVLLSGAALAGAGLAPLFPTAVAIYQYRARSSAGRMIGYVFAAGGLGGALFPWLVGLFSSATGSLTSALLIALLAAAGMKLTSRCLLDSKNE